MRTFTVAFIGGIIGTVFASVIALAWTGPTSAPPNGNVAAPINVGTVDQIKNAGLGINSLAVFGNAIFAGVSSYLNFGNTSGSSGYGFRDNAGTMEFKNSVGSWQGLLGTSSTFTQIKFADGTTQTTAQAGSDAGTLCGLATGLMYYGCSYDQSVYGGGYTSVASCKGQSIVSSCPTGYTQRTIETAQIYQTCTGACPARYYCARTCSKN